MIAENYTSDVYCDGFYVGWECTEKAEFIGESRAETHRKARKAGWAISEKTGKAYCPKHNKWKRKS